MNGSEPPSEIALNQLEDASSLERLRRSTSAIWLLQRNPRSGDVMSGSPGSGLPHTGCVKRYLDEIDSGDRVVLWLSGRSAGVYALGEVTDQAASRRDEVHLDLFVDLRLQPLPRAMFKTDRRFAGESILRQPFGANPHRVSADAFDAILEAADRELRRLSR